jgi:hypothetical protein
MTGPSTAATHSHETPHSDSRLWFSISAIAVQISG